MTKADTLIIQIEDLSKKVDQARSMIWEVFIGHVGDQCVVSKRGAPFG